MSAAIHSVLRCCVSIPVRATQQWHVQFNLINSRQRHASAQHKYSHNNQHYKCHDGISRLVHVHMCVWCTPARLIPSPSAGIPQTHTVLPRQAAQAAHIHKCTCYTTRGWGVKPPRFFAACCPFAAVLAAAAAAAAVDSVRA